MTRENEEHGKRVRDEEGSVDEKLKDRIIQARNRVDEREDGIYVKGPLEGVQIGDQRAVQMWATSVRQYLRAVEPLLRSEEIADAETYYTEKTIADQAVYPPDGTYPRPDGPLAGTAKPREYRWSLFYRDGISKRQAIEAHDHSAFTRSFVPPEPERITITGLRDVIERETVGAEWSVTVNPGVIDPQQITVAPSVRFPLRRDWLMDAVRLTDEFLQNAGIAIDVGFEERDVKELNPV